MKGSRGNASPAPGLSAIQTGMPVAFVHFSYYLSSETHFFVSHGKFVWFQAYQNDRIQCWFLMLEAEITLFFLFTFESCVSTHVL